MACIAVLDHNQKESDKARRFVKRSEGQTLVRRALAYWVIKNAIARLLPPHPGTHPHSVPPNSGYIPDRMPSVEVPGVYFEDPRNPHRPLAQVIRYQENAPA